MPLSAALPATPSSTSWYGSHPAARYNALSHWLPFTASSPLSIRSIRGLSAACGKVGLQHPKALLSRIRRELDGSLAMTGERKGGLGGGEGERGVLQEKDLGWASHAS